MSNLTLTYDEALKLSLTRRWKIGICSQGDWCWCRTIELEEPIDFFENSLLTGCGFDDKLTHISSDGELSKIVAEHIVQLHNNSLQ